MKETPSVSPGASLPRRGGGVELVRVDGAPAVTGKGLPQGRKVCLYSPQGGMGIGRVECAKAG
jgi:hypothetical protein